jgi:hypothetical protein
MREIRIEFKLTKHEKRTLDMICKSSNSNLSDYIRRRLFSDNEDFADFDEKFISPISDKHNLLTITSLYKLSYMLSVLLGEQDLDVKEVNENALEYARSERKKHGYKIVKLDGQS